MLLILLVVTLAVTSILLSGASKTNLDVQRQKKNLAVLAQAKEALIAWSVLNTGIDDTLGTVDDRPGTLPCPDFNLFGGANSGSDRELALLEVVRR